MLNVRNALLMLLAVYICSASKTAQTGVRSRQRRSKLAHGECGEDFPCLNSTQCIRQDEICDGTPDCDNGSDEWEDEECKDWHLSLMINMIFGSKEDDSEEDDDDDDGHVMLDNVRTTVPCELGTYPETCDCFVEMEGRQWGDFPSMVASVNATAAEAGGGAYLGAGPAGNRTDGSTRFQSDSGGTVVGIKLDCSLRDLTSFPRNVPENTISIDVSDNKITALSKEDFANLTQLRQLMMSRNKFQFIEEGAFESLTNLELLKMIACGLKELPQRMFSAQSQLASLYLSYNKFKRLTKGSFHGLGRLEYLDVSANMIAEIEKGVFDDVAGIYVLLMSQNKLTTISSSMLSRLRELKSLNIHRNFIATIEKGSFAATTKLHDLNLADNMLTGIRRGLFHNLTNVVSLSLRNNSIRSFEDDAFDGMNHLQTLTLSDNPFTSLPIGLFEDLHSLSRIYFDHFSLCGYAPHVRNCQPKSDGISTAENLLSNALLRFAVWIVALLASLGNAFVLFARCFVQEDKKTHSFFIMNLAVSDLLMGLYLLTIGIHDVIFRGDYILHDLAWRTGSVCKLGGFLSLLSSEVSIMTLTVITLDRFLSIVHPFRFKNRSLLHARLLMVLLWSLGIALATLPLVHSAYFGEFYYGGNGVCLPLQIDRPFAEGWQFSLVIFVVFNLVAFTFILYAYLMMFITIRRSNLAMRSTKKNQDWALVKRFTFIVATDFVCWMPIIIVKFVALGGVSVSQSVYAWFAIFVLPINSALNPILYTMTTVLFKQKVLAPLGIVKAQRKKEYLSGASVDETSTMSKNSGTRLSIISNKSRGGSMNGKFNSNKKLKRYEISDTVEESFISTINNALFKRPRTGTASYQELPTSEQESTTPSTVVIDVLNPAE